MGMRWYDETQTPFLPNANYSSFVGALTRQAVACKKPVLIGSRGGSTGPQLTEIVAGVLSLPGAFLARVDIEDSRNCTIVGESFVLSMDTYEDSATVSYSVIDPDTQRAITKLVGLLPPAVANPDTIYAITQSRDGLVLTRVGTVGAPLVEENYTADNVAQFQHVAADLLAADPCGRLTILSGVPGTGKTFLVRALVNAGKGGTFVMIPPHMVHSLGDPGLVNLLIEHKEDHVNQPLIMVLEDADSILVPRAADNMNAISGLLNLSDGLLGRALDIRIIATTNAVIEDMDEALTRPGRLCRHITTGPLPAAQADALCRKMGVKRPTTWAATLAEIYKWAKDPGVTGPAKDKPRGFNPNRS